MATQQELVDEIYRDFTQQIDGLKIHADTPAVQVTGKLIRLLKRVCNSHGGTVTTINGKKYTQSALDESELDAS